MENISVKEEFIFEKFYDKKLGRFECELTN